MSHYHQQQQHSHINIITNNNIIFYQYYHQSKFHLFLKKYSSYPRPMNQTILSSLKNSIVVDIVDTPLMTIIIIVTFIITTIFMSFMLPP